MKILTLVGDAKELALRIFFESAGNIIDKVLDVLRGTFKTREAVVPKQLARRINREKEACFHESTCRAQI